MGAVFFCDGVTSYTHGAVPERVVCSLKERCDEQIVALEMLAVVFALLAFLPHLADRAVRIWVDNAAAECILKRGSAASSDHNWICHEIWTLCFKHKIGLWVERVSSDDNVADEPSRRKFDVVGELGKEVAVPACTSDVLWNFCCVAIGRLKGCGDRHL